MATYMIFHVEPDSTYSPVLAAPEYTNKAKAIKMAKALAKSEAFADSWSVDVVEGDMAVASFPTKRSARA